MSSSGQTNQKADDDYSSESSLDYDELRAIKLAKEAYFPTVKKRSIEETVKRFKVGTFLTGFLIQPIYLGTLYYNLWSTLLIYLFLNELTNMLRKPKRD